MKAITNTAPGKLHMLDIPLPQPAAGQVRIATKACGICATDLEMIAGWDRTGFPSIPGHEWAGIVDAIGAGVDPDLKGRLCVAENVLSDGGEVGFEHPGGYAQSLVTAAANVHVLPDEVSPVTATLIEPLAVTVRAVNRLRLTDHAAALVFGDGPIGLLTVGLLHRAGVDTIVLVGGRPGRLAVGVHLGATQTLNYHDFGDSLAAGIRAACPVVFPNVIEASGAATAMAASLDLVARCGKIVVVGDYGTARANFPWNHLLHKEIELIGSNASAGAWSEAVNIAIEQSLPLADLVTHRFPAARFAEGVALAASGRDDVIKVVLEW